MFKKKKNLGGRLYIEIVPNHKILKANTHSCHLVWHFPKKKITLGYLREVIRSKSLAIIKIETMELVILNSCLIVSTQKLLGRISCNFGCLYLKLLEINFF